MYPRQSSTTHTEQLGDEASVYDWSRAQVHALNPTAACVWRRCDGATSPDAIAAALRVELGILEADAVVDLTLAQLARVHLLELPAVPRGEQPATTRRWLLSRGVAAAMLPAIYSIVAPTPVEAQSPGPAPGAPTLTGLSPNQGSLGTTVTVTLTGTNFIVGATTVNVASGGVTATNVVVSSATSLTVDIVIDAAATPGAHTVTVTTAGGTSGGRTFTVSVASGSTAFTFTGSPEFFTVPAGVVAVTIEATGARGAGGGFDPILGGSGGSGGRTTATVSVTPGSSLTVRVGGTPPAIATSVGGFNGGGGSTGIGGGGGGASDVYQGGTPLLIAGGGGGGGSESGGGVFANPNGGNGGGGGGLTGGAGGTVVNGGGGGSGGTQAAGGVGGIGGNLSGTDGTAGQGGTGGYHQPGVIGGGGGGGGYFGGGGGGGGDASNGAGGGGGGSSFAAPGATAVVHEQGVNSGVGSVTISW